MEKIDILAALEVCQKGIEVPCRKCPLHKFGRTCQKHLAAESQRLIQGLIKQVDVLKESHNITQEKAEKKTAQEILQDLFYFIDGNSFWLTEPKEEYITQKNALAYMRKQAYKYGVEVEE